MDQEQSLDLAMFAAMVGGQLRQVDKSMEQISNTHGAATKIDPYRFIPGAQPQNLQGSFNNPQRGSTTWYAPSEEDVMRSVPDQDAAAFRPPPELRAGKELDREIPAASSRQEIEVSSRRLRRSSMSQQNSSAPDELTKVLKSIDKTLKTINKTLRTVYQVDVQMSNDGTSNQ